MHEAHLDPEFEQLFARFAQQEVPQQPGQQLEETTRYLAILCALMGCQGVEEFRRALPRALDAGLDAVAVKEAVYQAVAYLGIGKVRPFLTATNEVLAQRGVALPLAGQATVTPDDRLGKGVQAQVAIFGDGMREAWKSGHIHRYLAANCFGDSYTRTGLTLAQREMVTF